MDIKAEIKVSFLAGLIEVKGAGSFLKEKKRTSKSASMTLMYNKATGTDRIELRHLKVVNDRLPKYLVGYGFCGF